MSFSRSWRGCCQQEEKAREEDFKDHETGGGSPAEGIATMCWHRLPSRAGSLCRHWLALCSTLVCNIWTGSLIKTELPILQLTNYKQGLSAGLCCKLDGSAPVGGWQEGLENCSLEKRQLFRNDCKLIEKANSLIIVLIIIVTKNFHQYWCIFLTLIRVRCKTQFYHLATSASREQTAAQFILSSSKHRLELQLLPTTPEAWIHGGGQTS